MSSVGEAEGQLRLYDGNLPGIIPKLVTDIAPALPEAHRPFGNLLRLQTVAAIRLHQGQRQHDHRLAGRAVQRQRGRQRIGIVRINHRAILEPDLQPVSLQAAQFEHLWFEGRLNHSPEGG